MTDHNLSCARPTTPAEVPDLALERCHYCGARLNPCFYFCVHCATPYKDVSAVNLNPLAIPYLFGFGVTLGWVKWKTGSLYPPMLIHLLHNWVVVQWG